MGCRGRSPCLRGPVFVVCVHEPLGSTTAHAVDCKPDPQAAGRPRGLLGTEDPSATGLSQREGEAPRKTPGLPLRICSANPGPTPHAQKEAPPKHSNGNLNVCLSRGGDPRDNTPSLRNRVTGTGARLGFLPAGEPTPGDRPPLCLGNVSDATEVTFVPRGRWCSCGGRTPPTGREGGTDAPAPSPRTGLQTGPTPRERL